MESITNQLKSGFKGLAEYQKAYEDLKTKYSNFAWKTVSALDYNKDNFSLAITASMQGFARELKELDAKWINSNLKEPLTDEEKKDGEDADQYDVERDLENQSIQQRN